MSNYNYKFVQNAIFVIVVLFLQGYVFGAMQPLHGFINIYFYFLPLLFLSIRTSYYKILMFSLFLGLCMDIIHDSLGLFMMASLWVGYMRNIILKYLFSERNIKMLGDQNITIKLVGLSSFFAYVFVLCAVHNFVIILLEWFTLTVNYYIILKWVSDSLYSTIVFFIIYVLYKRIIK